MHSTQPTCCTKPTGIVVTEIKFLEKAEAKIVKSTAPWINRTYRATNRGHFGMKFGASRVGRLIKLMNMETIIFKNSV